MRASFNGRVYSAVMSGVTVSAAQDLFQLTAPSNKGFRVLRCEVANDTDETSQVLPIQFIRGVGATAGSGGAAVTPAALKVNSAASSVAVARNNTTAMTAGGGTLTTLLRRDFNVVTGFVYEPTEDRQIIEVAPGERLTVNLPTAPSAGIPFSGEIIFEEIE